MAACDLNEKVVKYEEFLNNTLKRDLNELNGQREKIYEEITEYLHLQTTLQKLNEGGLNDYKKSLKTKVDLGCNFFVQAVVKGTSRILVHVGYGFYVEFTWPEAIAFIEAKVSNLNKQADKISKDMATVRAQIRLVLEGLRELQGL